MIDLYILLSKQFYKVYLHIYLEKSIGIRNSVSKRVYYNAGITSSYVGIDEYGPLLFLGFNEGEWWSLRLSHPQYDGKPAVFLTTVAGGLQVKWHG